jgi:WD40 repeat protein
MHTFDKAGYGKWSPDGRWLVSKLYGSFELWDPAEGSRIKTFKNVNPDVNAAFSADCQLLAIAFRDGTVVIWDVATQSEIQRIKTPSSSVYQLAFSIDSQDLAIAWDGNVEIWDMSSRTCVQTLDMSSRIRVPTLDISLGSEYLKLTLSRRSQRLVTVIKARDDEFSITSVWNLSTGALLDTLYPTSIVFSLALTANGQCLATMSTTSMDNLEIQIWDVTERTVTYSQRMDIPETAHNIQFDPTNNSRLSTYAGVIDLGQIGVGYCGYGLVHDKEGEWIVKGSERMLWVPPEYRSVSSVSMMGSSVALGSSTGRVLLMRFE